MTQLVQRSGGFSAARLARLHDVMAGYVERAREHHPDLVLVDLHLPDTTGTPAPTVPPKGSAMIVVHTCLGTSCQVQDLSPCTLTRTPRFARPDQSAHDGSRFRSGGVMR